MTATTVTRPARTGFRLMLTHARYNLVETVRIPIVIISLTVFPALAFVFFVVPQDFSGMPAAATEATVQLLVFSLMSTCLFTFGSGIAADRATPWDPYVRTLPAGAIVRVGSRLLAAIPLAGLGVLPLLVVSTLLTAATVTPVQGVLGLVALVAGALPFLFMGFAIGFAMSEKASIATVQLVFLPMSFVGGLFLPPAMFPGWLDSISLFTPSRAGRDLAVAVTGGGDVSVSSILVLVVWTVAMAALAVWAYARNEGTRFR